MVQQNLSSTVVMEMELSEQKSYYTSEVHAMQLINVMNIIWNCSG